MIDWYGVARNRMVLVGAVLVIGVLLAGLLAPMISPNDPIKITPDALAPPTREHPFGTDDLGRDILPRMLYGARISPIVGLIAVAISTVAGVSMGLVSGYAGGPADNVIMRVVNLLLSFTGILLTLRLIAI